jgi:hypothetical protein
MPTRRQSKNVAAKKRARKKGRKHVGRREKNRPSKRNTGKAYELRSQQILKLLLPEDIFTAQKSMTGQDGVTLPVDIVIESKRPYVLAPPRPESVGLIV